MTHKRDERVKGEAKLAAEMRRQGFDSGEAEEPER